MYNLRWLVIIRVILALKVASNNLPMNNFNQSKIQNSSNSSTPRPRLITGLPLSMPTTTQTTVQSVVSKSSVILQNVTKKTPANVISTQTSTPSVASQSITRTTGVNISSMATTHGYLESTKGTSIVTNAARLPNTCFCNHCTNRTPYCITTHSCFNTTISSTMIYGCTYDDMPIVEYTCSSATCCQDKFFCNINPNLFTNYTKKLTPYLLLQNAIIRILEENRTYEFSADNYLKTKKYIKFTDLINSNTKQEITQDSYLFQMTNNQLYKIQSIPMIGDYIFIGLRKTFFITQLYNYVPEWFLEDITIPENIQTTIVCLQCMNILTRYKCRDCLTFNSYQNNYIFAQTFLD